MPSIFVEQFLTRPFNRPMKKQVCKGHLFTCSARFTAPWEEQKLRLHRSLGDLPGSQGAESLCSVKSVGFPRKTGGPENPGTCFLRSQSR